jgi:hypothetical protein
VPQSIRSTRALLQASNDGYGPTAGRCGAGGLVATSLRGMRFGRRSPAQCTLLWEVVDLAGGRDDDEAASRVVQAAEALNARRRGELLDQYCQAMAALDTAEHARWIAGRPWRGPGQPFTPRLFLHARESAILFGREFYLGALEVPQRMAFAGSVRTIMLLAEFGERAPRGTMLKVARRHGIGSMQNSRGWPDLPEGYDPYRHDPENEPLTIMQFIAPPAEVPEERLDRAAERATELVWDLLGRPVLLTEDDWSSLDVEVRSGPRWEVEELDRSDSSTATVTVSAPMAGLETWTDDRLREVIAAVAARGLLTVAGIRLRTGEREVLTRLEVLAAELD